ncbi:hypothetical protein EMPS_07232 [Entomortierella parvispora]|uniref:Uncharacterized protein n=1 Tax=Entomortierella parvispora TaxID=205924 RepID=A0A9P3LY61_9FUNG|nr:hypothetical protein EMPS_07232 [Entomortierella parvispora]
MATLAQNIVSYASLASFEPIDPQERETTRGTGKSLQYYWPIESSEHLRLCEVFGLDAVAMNGTWTSRGRSNCSTCGKREEFLDQIYTAAKMNVHDTDFFKGVVSGEIPRIGTGAEHSMHCANCDTQLDSYFWLGEGIW